MHRGLWHHRTEVEAIETCQALVRSDPEITVRRLRNRMDCAFQQPTSCAPLLADVLGSLPIWIQRPRSTKQTRHRQPSQDRKSTRLNSSHMSISYAVFCLKKKK